VARADSAFSTGVFDSIGWASDSIRAFDGNVVYATYCRNCHGTLGAGETEYARNRQLEVPSLVEPEWRYADSRDSILHRIFVGHAAGMPTWGVAGITPREMDAVTFYLTEVLRPEVLSGG
jgi:mono/diheme cytochrome c family protein